MQTLDEEFAQKNRGKGAGESVKISCNLYVIANTLPPGMNRYDPVGLTQFSGGCRFL